MNTDTMKCAAEFIAAAEDGLSLLAQAAEGLGLSEIADSIVELQLMVAQSRLEWEHINGIARQCDPAFDADPIHRGFVITDKREVLFQVPDESVGPNGFYLCDCDGQTWNFGLGVAEYWTALSDHDSRITDTHRQRFEWIIDSDD